MRKFLAGLLGMVLCVQTVYGIPVRAADVFEPGERQKAMLEVIRQEDPEQTNRDNSGNLTGLELSAESFMPEEQPVIRQAVARTTNSTAMNLFMLITSKNFIFLYHRLSFSPSVFSGRIKEG